jgi:hypothetical protein
MLFTEILFIEILKFCSPKFETTTVGCHMFRPPNSQFRIIPFGTVEPFGGNEKRCILTISAAFWDAAADYEIFYAASARLSPYGSWS